MTNTEIIRLLIHRGFTERNARLVASEINQLHPSLTPLWERWAKNASVQEVEQRVVDTINAIDGLEVEYYEIVDQTTLLPAKDFSHAIGCVTVYCGPVRLIDNIKYTPANKR